jgi:hypothetical protein
MFIAVINENFEVAEEAKKAKQATHFWSNQQPDVRRWAWARRLNPYRWVRPAPKAIAVENLPASLVLPMQKALVQDDYAAPALGRLARSSSQRTDRATTFTGRSLRALKAVFEGARGRDGLSAGILRQHARGDTRALHPDDWDHDVELLELARPDRDAADADGLADAALERRAQKADFIRQHPSYDRTFWLFSQRNPLRRLCQMLVRPAGGERIFGRAPSDIASPAFHLVLALTVVGGVAVEAVATPLYRRQYLLTNAHAPQRGAWFDVAESAFSLALIVEFLIKVVADGFVFTPNAYARSIWNLFDLAVLAGITVNVATTLIFVGGLSRFTRSLKALRALRLITLIEPMRKTFSDIILSGITNIFDAALLALLYMIPYAVWGLNLFAGLMAACNDGAVPGRAACTGEFATSTAGDGAFGFLVPRVWDNPSPSTTFSFDNFRSSLLILFEIVSLEGWVDVMGVATAITGAGSQPATNAAPINAIFFVFYNLLGAVVILTIFVRCVCVRG